MRILTGGNLSWSGCGRLSRYRMLLMAISMSAAFVIGHSFHKVITAPTLSNSSTLAPFKEAHTSKASMQQKGS